ncbi:MAG TPA: hypothetical protein VGB69_04995, partial [Edaphobacter sp.]
CRHLDRAANASSVRSGETLQFARITTEPPITAAQTSFGQIRDRPIALDQEHQRPHPAAALKLSKQIKNYASRQP